MPFGPNDFSAASSLIWLPVVWISVPSHAVGRLWAALALTSAGVSLAYYAVETTRYDLGSHRLPGAQWLQPYEELLLPMHRTAAVCTGIAAVGARGGPSESMQRLGQAPALVVWLVLGVAALLASDLGGFTRWQYALLHSFWQISLATTEGLLLLDSASDREKLHKADLLVIGLGNPGYEYAGTRHNVGVDVMYSLCRRWDVTMSTEHTAARSICVERKGLHVVVARSKTYMNASGRAVNALCKAYGISAGPNLVVVHDELDLPPGRMKLQRGGGEAGHNGLRSIMQHTRSVDFIRIRVGVGKPPRGQGTDWVLAQPDEESAKNLKTSAERAADAIERFLEAGLEATMSRYNGKHSIPHVVVEDKEDRLGQH